MLVQSSQRAGAMRKLIAPLLVICLSVLGLSAQAEANTRAPIVSAATSIQGCNEGLIMHNGAYTCRSILWVSQGGVMTDRYASEGGLIPDPVVVAERHVVSCRPMSRAHDICTYSDGATAIFASGGGFISFCSSVGHAACNYSPPNPYLTPP